MLVCNCKEDVFIGIPCRHQIAIILKSKCSPKFLPFNQRWLLSYFEDNLPYDPEELSEPQTLNLQIEV